MLKIYKNNLKLKYTWSGNKTIGYISYNLSIFQNVCLIKIFIGRQIKMGCCINEIKNKVKYVNHILGYAFTKIN